LPAQEEQLIASRAVHFSIDPSITTADKKAVTSDEDDKEAATDPDKPITQVRFALPTDGLLSNSELASLFSSGIPLRSAYDEVQREYKEVNANSRTFGDRVALLPQRLGAYEPEWTSYTHYWKTVLGM
jgi:RNA exonuclease NGL2